MKREATIKRLAVDSTMIRSLGWDNGTLEVQFKNGEVFIYSGVPQVVYARVSGAKSVGKRFNALIRDHYDFKKVRK